MGGRLGVALVVCAGALGLVPVLAGEAASEPVASFHPIQPTRVMDTRAGQAGPGFGTNETRYLQVSGVAGVPSEAIAVALNVTVTEPTAPGYVTVWPSGSAVPTA